MGLEKLDISTVGREGHSDDKVVYIGEDRSLIYHWVEWGDIDDEQQRRDAGALGGANGHWGEDLGRALVQETASSVGEETADPRDQVLVGTLGPKERS